jgi:CRP/FNR family transcriptional regulator
MHRAGRLPHKTSKVALNCFACQNRDRSEWCSVQHGDVELLNSHKQSKTYRPGEFLFQQGDPCQGVYVIERGTVGIRKNDTLGNTVLLRLCHAGQTIGYRDYLAGRAYTTSADALVDATVCFIDRAAVQTMLARNPALGLRFVQRITEDLDSAEDTILQTSALPVRMRLAHLLLMLKDRYGTAAEDGSIVLELPLARQDIAAILGARPETITRTIQKLEAEGIVRFSGRTAIIADLDTLLDDLQLADEG